MTRRLLLLAIALLAAPLFAQKKVLTLESIYDPATKVNFSGAVQSGFQWLDDKTFVWPRTDEKGELVEWRLFDTSTGRERPFIDRAKLQAGLQAAGLSADEAKRIAGSRSYDFDAKKSAIVFTAADDLFVYSLPRGTVTRLTSAPGEEEDPGFSPDGQRVAFVRGNNLFVVDLQGRERQLTTDGSDMILNGKLDWVYEEEVYGRGKPNAYWWSPDSTRIAFLRLDEHGVYQHTITEKLPYHVDVQVYPYPKAGDANPKASLFVSRALGGEPVKVDTQRYSAGDHLIVAVGWKPDSSAVTYQVQDREQTWLDLDSADPSTGAAKTILHDATKAWIEPLDNNPLWLADGSFLWQSERSGFRHVYRYAADGAPAAQITKGEWEVRNLFGADVKNGFLYFSGTERSPIGEDVYRIKLDGSGLQRLSTEAGTHSASFNPANTMYVDRWSDVRTPNQVRFYRADGKLAYVVDEGRSGLIGEYDIPQPEFLQVKTRDGFVMEAMMIRPTNFDPAKKYPVFEYHYAGPHAQTVRNMWNARGNLFLQLVAQQGVIVWECDNRTASGKGAVSAWPLYKEFGRSELADIEDGIAWLKQQPYVDGSRIMLSGWSYGGFMTSYALTHSTTFIAGIAGGPVEDWRDYDSIYTERYLLMPQNNPEGYRKSSPRFAAKDLHGNLLLIHGEIDDNVHIQNTIQMMDALQRAGKRFELMIYPKSRHGVTDKQLVLHLEQTEMDFIKRNLLGK